MIYKQVLGLTDEQRISVPADAKFLHVYEQEVGKVTIWYHFEDHNSSKVTKTILIVGTGNQFPKLEPTDEYVGTVMSRMGLVWHVWARG